jgi:hypothetical protein
MKGFKIEVSSNYENIPLVYFALGRWDFIVCNKHSDLNRHLDGKKYVYLSCWYSRDIDGIGVNSLKVGHIIISGMLI